MLIEFRVTNFRSFRDTQVLSMVAASGKEHLSTHTFDPSLPNFKRLLASAALYGPNAAGKTNLLKALQFMQTMVTQSAVSNPVTELSYAPFKFDLLTSKAPSEFAVTFADPDAGTRYEYGFAVDAERVHHEWLTEHKTKSRRIFERTYDVKREEYLWDLGRALKGNKALWRDSTRPNALFLSTAVQLNNTQLLPVFWWFQKKLVAIVGASTFNLNLSLKFIDDLANKERLLAFVREADPFIADVTVSREPMKPGALFVGSNLPLLEQANPTETPTVAKVTFSHPSANKTGKSKESVGIDLSDESNGTQVLFRTAGAWLNVFANGEVLLVDEVDNSLHPLLVKFLIDSFHSKKTNPRHAQLIFTTHNTTLLNQEVFRRDQIWFMEKTPENYSRCYALTDFSPRKDEVIASWYMRGRYGALPILSDIAAK